MVSESANPRLKIFENRFGKIIVKKLAAEGLSRLKDPNFE
jgi:hypothetical protein